MPGMLVAEISKNDGVNDLIVDDKVVLVFNEREVHVRHPVNEHERNSEACADAYHQTDQQGKPDQKMAPRDKEGNDRRHTRGREHREEVVKSFGVTQKP